MAYEHESGIAGAFDRTPSAPDERTALVFVEDRYCQGAELNELQGLAGRRIQAIGNMVAGNGNRESGAEIKVALDIDPEDPNVVPTTASIILQPGKIYVDGHVLSVPAAQFDNVAIAGDVFVGVRQVVTYVGHEEDGSLVGQQPGSEAEGEPGAYRTNRTLAWALLNDGGEGQFIQVYQVRDGTVVDQTAPAAFDGPLATAAIYDRALGSYIVSGCEVTALGDDGEGNQILSIAAGAANIQGWRRTRETAFTLFLSEDPDLELVSAETLSFADAGSGTAVLTVGRPPIANLVSAVVTKRVSENVTRGAVPNGLDTLQEGSIVRIESVTQGATTFDPATYTLQGDEISWAPVGDEPASGSTYVVTYLYFDQVAPDAFDATTVTLSGGVTGETVLLTYNSKIPRKDILVFDINGTPFVVKGVSARKGALPPKPPEGHLKLAEIHNTWDVAPVIVNNGTRVPTYDELWGYLRLTVKTADQLNRTILEQSVPDAAAVSADGIFTDDFRSDFYRDAGVIQSAAANQGVLQLPVYQTFLQTVGGLEMLDYTEQVIISQPLATGSMKVNPYANFNPMPGLLALNPNNDFWTATETQWTSAVTREFTAAPGQSPGRSTINEEVSQTTREAEFLRQIDIDFSIEGFAPNEQLEKLLFGGRDVTPAGPLAADANGEIAGTFQIPARVPTGTHAIRAEGAAGGFAQASFVGSGQITVEVMRQVHLVTHSAPPPVINVINQITRVTNVTNVSNRNSGSRESSGREGGMNGDPLAWTFVPPNDCFMLGFDVEIAAVGSASNGLLCQLATTLNGYPTNVILADAFIPMAGVQPGDKVRPRWNIPHYLSASEKYCIVIMTDDPDHAVRIATLGEVVPETQQLVASQPYTNGDLFSGSNRTTWVAHPKSDLKIDIVAARFNPTEKTVQLFEGAVAAITDLVVRGTAELQSDQTRFRYELERANGDVIPLAPGQAIEFDEYVSETLKLRAVLSGTEYLSPVLWPGTTIIGGQLQEQADYVSRHFTIDGVIGFRELFDRWQPAGATVSAFVDAGDDNWQPLVQESARALGGGWTEPKLTLAGFSAPNGGRVKITLNGTPAARPSIARLRAYGY